MNEIKVIRKVAIKYYNISDNIKDKKKEKDEKDEKKD
jgi:hypothetical protein